VLIEYLPRESATARAVHGPELQWGDTEHLLAQIADALHAANWQRGHGKGPRPRPLPRPGKEEPDRKRYGRGGIPLSEAAAYFERWRSGAFATGGGEN